MSAFLFSPLLFYPPFSSLHAIVSVFLFPFHAPLFVFVLPSPCPLSFPHSLKLPLSNLLPSSRFFSFSLSLCSSFPHLFPSCLCLFTHHHHWRPCRWKLILHAPEKLERNEKKKKKKKISVSKRFKRHRKSSAGDSLCCLCSRVLSVRAIAHNFYHCNAPPLLAYTHRHTPPPRSLSDDKEMLSGTDYQPPN